MSLSLVDRFHIWRRKLRWDKQYKKGKWSYLKNDNEAFRYKKIIEFLELYSKKQPKILDLGCGEGVLTEYLKDFNYDYFLGVDYSKVSVLEAKEKKLKKADFLVADLHYYEPSDEFDVVVLNEAFYYINDKLKETVIKRILNCLKENGIIITSIYKEGIGCWEYFDIEQLQQLDFTTVTTPKEGTYWKVGVYKKLD